MQLMLIARKRGLKEEGNPRYLVNIQNQTRSKVQPIFLIIIFQSLNQPLLRRLRLATRQRSGSTRTASSGCRARTSWEAASSAWRRWAGENKSFIKILLWNVMSGRGAVQRSPVLAVPRPPVRGERGLHPARLPRPGPPPLRQGRGLEPRHGQLHRQLRPVRPLGTISRISTPGMMRRGYFPPCPMTLPVTVNCGHQWPAHSSYSLLLLDCWNCPIAHSYVIINHTVVVVVAMVWQKNDNKQIIVVGWSKH